MNDGKIPFVVALWVVVIIRSAIVGFGQNNGLVQVIILIVVDLLFCFGERGRLTYRNHALKDCFQFSSDSNRTTRADTTGLVTSSKSPR